MQINTPCIGICSTVYGDDICRGCKRHYIEVIDWNTYTETEKQVVFDRLAADIVQIMQEKVIVINKKDLEEQLNKHNIRYREEQSPLCWAYHLLRVASEKITSLTAYGIAIQPAYQHYSLRQLFTLLDRELLSLAQTKLMV